MTERTGETASSSWEEVHKEYKTLSQHRLVRSRYASQRWVRVPPRVAASALKPGVWTTDMHTTTERENRTHDCRLPSTQATLPQRQLTQRHATRARQPVRPRCHRDNSRSATQPVSPRWPALGLQVQSARNGNEKLTRVRRL